MMTKKDYELIARVIKQNFKSFKDLDIHPSHWQHLLVSELARELHQDNYKFDWRKFKQACGIDTAVTTSDGRKVKVVIED